MGPSSTMGPSLNGPKLNNANSKELKYILVEGMGCRSHRSLHVLNRSFFILPTHCLWASTLYWTLIWPAYAQFVGPNIFPTVHFGLPNVLVFVHPEVHVAVKVVGPKLANGLVCDTLTGAQQALLVEHANHVPARLPVHHNIIATLLNVHQHFMRRAVGSSNVLHVVDSGAA